MATFVKIRSWHILDPEERDLTLCGRVAHGHVQKDGSEPPMNQKGCETCDRVARRRQAEL